MSIKVKINNDWVDTNIKAVRGVNHVNSEDVYTRRVMLCFRARSAKPILSNPQEL